MSDLAKQINLAYAEEHAAHKLPKTRDDIPLSYEDISPEWLTSVLCADASGCKVVSHRLGPPEEGTNNRRRIYVTYNAEGVRAGLPQSVFCKATQGLANRQMLGHSGGIICEVTFYRVARKMLDIEAPVALLANYDPVSFNSIVVLEDIADRAEFCSEDFKVDRSFIEGQLTLLARLHGRFYESPELRTTLAGLPTWYERFHKLARFHLKESCEAGFLAAEDIIPPSLFRRAEEVWPATLQSLEAIKDFPAALCHGDVHLKNWYVLNDGTIGLGDWGVAHRGNWARDMVYTMTTSLTVADRRLWQDDLLRFYLDQLHAAGGARIDLDSAKSACRHSLLTAFAFWTLTLKPTPDYPDMQPSEAARTFIERMAAAVADWEVF